MVITINTNILNHNNDYDVIIGNNLLDNIEDYIAFPRRTLIITDTNIPDDYSSKIVMKSQDAFVYKLKPGEKSKNIKNYQKIISFLLDKKFTRDDLIITLGGGVIGDLGGYVAATYKRGINFINIPTSTLSMIDSSIGGKVAINYNGIKNAVGTFYMPKKVIISFDTLKSLPKRHYNNGLMEALKAGLIYDKDLYNLFKNNKIDNIEEIVIKSLNVKKNIVEIDPYELNIRKVLNFGHTIGHAIESENYDKIYHGEAIALGMLYFLGDKLRKEVECIVYRMIGKRKISLDVDKAIKIIANDKKIINDYVNIIKVDTVGKAEIVNYSIDELKNVLGENL